MIMLNPVRRTALRVALLSYALAGTLAGAEAHARQTSRASQPPRTDQPRTIDQKKTPPTDTDPRWLDRIDKRDRALLDELIGFAPPGFTDDLTWLGAEPMTWDDLHGKVVVLQSWTSRNSAGRGASVRLTKALADVPGEHVRVLLLHTPEGADKLQRFLERRPLDLPVILDARGGFCDDLGVYKKPVNIVVDRTGAVRYAGLKWKGAQAAVTALLAEPYDPAVRPTARPEPPVPTAAEYPAITGSVSSAKDVRGQRAPEFHVQKWITNRPDPSGQVVVLDFWATWCGPCRASIPHMNALADKLRDRVCVVGISDESSGSFDQGMIKHRLRKSDFHYALALDSTGRMKKALQIRGIPHAIVMSSDWTVRWQGHPASLDEATLRRIVEADAGAMAVDRGRPRRWTGGR